MQLWTTLKTQHLLTQQVSAIQQSLQVLVADHLPLRHFHFTVGTVITALLSGKRLSFSIKGSKLEHFAPLGASGLQQLHQLVEIDAIFGLVQLRLPTFELVWRGNEQSKCLRTAVQHKSDTDHADGLFSSEMWSSSLLWMTICSNFLLLEALSNIFWSMVLAVTRRYTTTGLVWPMRWHRSWACRSAWGFWQRSKTHFQTVKLFYKIWVRYQTVSYGQPDGIGTHPITVKDDNCVGCRQVDPKSSCSGAQQEQEHLGIVGKFGDL